MDTLEETCDYNLGIKIERRKNSITNRNLLIAAWEGDVDKIRACVLLQGADIDFVDSDGNTPLHYAIRNKNFDSGRFDGRPDDETDSENVEVLKYLVENLKDINVENDKCKTPLDISIALKQNFAFNLISQKNVSKSLAIRRNEANQPFTGTVSFMEGSFHNDYRVPLSKEDIQNILDFKYFRKNRERVFKVIEFKNFIEMKEVIIKEIETFTETKETTRLILVGLYCFTLVFDYTREHNEYQFTAYYYDPFISYASVYTSIHIFSDFIIESIRSKGIELIHIKLNKFYKLRSQCGISALKCAEIFDPFLDEDEVNKELQGLNFKKEREFHANILMEKKRVEEKIAVCFETLHNLNKNGKDAQELNYKNANVFINFLEAFALEDTLPKLSKNLWTQEEEDEIEVLLTDLKKGYFTTYYFESKNKAESDSELIRKARNMILKANIIMQPQDFYCFMKDESSVGSFFKILEKYAWQIKNKIEQKLIQVDGDIYCYEFLTFATFTNQTQGDLLDICNFLHEIYKSEDEIKQEETIFNLTVNIFPIINKKKEKIGSFSVTLRNNLVHNYQEKSVLNNEKKYNEIKELHSLRSDLFKFFYSRKVHELLSEILDVDIETLQYDLQKILDDFQKEIIKEENIIISNEPLKSFEYVYQEPLFPERDENINLVDKYLIYAVIVEKNVRAKETQFAKLTYGKKRDLFEDFVKLKKSKESTQVQCQYERENLKQKLKTYGLDTNSFDRVVGFYLDGYNDLPGESMKKRDTIIDILSSLNQMKKKYSLSYYTIMNLYEKILELKKKGVIARKKYDSVLNEMLNESKIKKSQKDDILRTFFSFPGVESIDVVIGEEELVELNTFDVIRNIFVFCNSYDKYKIKCNNVEEAFNDDLFLDYLIKKQRNSSKSLTDTHFVYVLIKKLITIQFASPYIAKLLYECNDDKIIDKKDFVNLLGALMTKNAYVKHLTKLLKFKSVKFDVYGEFCDKILDNNFDVENICDIVQDHDHAKSILNKLNEKLKNVKKNYLAENEAMKILGFCTKILNKTFDIKNIKRIPEDYREIKVILLKLSEKIVNVNIEQSFKIRIKKVRILLRKKLSDIDVQEEFQNYCVVDTLCNLKDKVECRVVNYDKEKSIKSIENVILQILKQLNTISYDLYCESRYNAAIKLLEASVVAGNKLIQNDDLKNVLLNAEFQKARSMIQLTEIKNNKKKKIIKALGILNRIQDEQNRNPKFLLISAEIAYAERLLGRYERSYQSYVRLFAKIAVTVSSYQFSKIENSEEYQKMLTVSDEAKKYLSITNIRTSMALNKFYLGKKMFKDEEAISNLKESLQILKKLYSFRKKSLEKTSDAEKRSELAHIAFEIAKVKHELGRLSDSNAVQHYQEALVKCIQCCESLKEIYSSFHHTYQDCIFLMQTISHDLESLNTRPSSYGFQW